MYIDSVFVRFAYYDNCGLLYTCVMSSECVLNYILVFLALIHTFYYLISYVCLSEMVILSYGCSN